MWQQFLLLTDLKNPSNLRNLNVCGFVFFLGFWDNLHEMQRIPWFFFFLFFCYWWRDFFFLPVKDVLQPSAAASTSSRASPGVRSPLGLLPSKTGGRRWWKGSRTKRWEQEHVVSLENRWYEQGCVGAVTLFSYFSEPRATLSFGKSRHLITGQACFSPHLLHHLGQQNFFFSLNQII